MPTPILPEPPSLPQLPEPPDAPTTVAPTIRRTLAGLRAESERRTRPGRLLELAPLLAPALAARDAAATNRTTAPAASASDPLVGLLAQMRAVTTQYVCALRADGVPVERMLPGVKALVREAMRAERWHDDHAAQVLTVLVVEWSIAAYYDR